MKKNHSLCPPTLKLIAQHCASCLCVLSTDLQCASYSAVYESIGLRTSPAAPELIHYPDKQCLIMTNSSNSTG